ncbi:hypothetical protein TTHERM_00991610 (macronuclear) [Tetrahymena thermophila SB210]|uniref:Uncharacterized protein n=1 Tax=Tetrahymena thermophila (strain SB210) TaxID=312017 RepID=Q240I6_TETTS|nr:hypothetical protein TTHERM_00991610 [Tetrahymena thermophila SB210]EAS02222.2 hypothetical protein TTHERM_00991610 [Tetrahymena thermophila SB210]|eukprot:XP_001022467.2 hypothetical protein TTHERM_00991610 [Tetrahymena thermophila SB210]
MSCLNQLEVEKCKKCNVLHQANEELQNNLDSAREQIQVLKEEYESQISKCNQEFKAKILEFNSELIKQKENFNSQMFQLKEKYEKTIINREGTQYTINLQNQQLQRRQEYIEKLRVILQKKENQLLSQKDQYLINLSNLKNSSDQLNIDKIDKEFKQELLNLKNEYKESLTRHETDKQIEMNIIKDELKDAIIERDYYIKKFRDRLNEKEEYNKSVYESQCNQISSMISILNQQHQVQIKFYLAHINELENQVIQAKKNISKSALQDLVLQNGSSIFWQEGLELYKQHKIQEIQKILLDMKEKQLRHSQYLTKRFYSIVKTALVIDKYEKKFEFMKQLIEKQPNQSIKEEFNHLQQDQSIYLKNNSLQVKSFLRKQANDNSLKQLYQSLNNLDIIQQKNEQIVSEKIIQIFKLEQINQEYVQQIQKLKTKIQNQDNERVELLNEIEQKQKRIIELQNIIQNENKQFTLMLQLKKVELQELIKMNNQQVALKDRDIVKLCNDLEQLQAMLKERPSRNEDLKEIITLKSQLEIQTQRFNQLKLYIQSKVGDENFKFSMNGEKMIVDDTKSKVFKKLNSNQSTLENSYNSTNSRQKENSFKNIQAQKEDNSPKRNNQIYLFHNQDNSDLSSILQHQKLYTRSTTPQNVKIQSSSRVETEPSVQYNNTFNTIQQDSNLLPKKQLKLQNQKVYQTIQDSMIQTDYQRPKSQLNVNQQDQIGINYMQGFKKEIQKTHYEQVQINSDIFMNKKFTQIKRSQTPQIVRNRVQNRQNENESIKNQFLNSDNSNDQQYNNQDVTLQHINQYLNNYTPFVFKVKKHYSRSQTPQNIIRKE